jgi:hypothetical protein
MLKKILWFGLLLIVLAVLAQLVLSRGGLCVKVVNESGGPLQGLRLFANEAVIAQEATLAQGESARLLSQGSAAGSLRLEFKHGWNEEKQVFDDQVAGMDWRFYDLVIGPDGQVRVLSKSVDSF